MIVENLLPTPMQQILAHIFLPMIYASVLWPVMAYALHLCQKIRLRNALAVQSILEIVIALTLVALMLAGIPIREPT